MSRDRILNGPQGRVVTLALREVLALHGTTTPTAESARCEQCGGELQFDTDHRYGYALEACAPCGIRRRVVPVRAMAGAGEDREAEDPRTRLPAPRIRVGLSDRVLALVPVGAGAALLLRELREAVPDVSGTALSSTLTQLVRKGKVRRRLVPAPEPRPPKMRGRVYCFWREA